MGFRYTMQQKSPVRFLSHRSRTERPLGHSTQDHAAALGSPHSRLADPGQFANRRLTQSPGLNYTRVEVGTLG